MARLPFDRRLTLAHLLSIGIVVVWVSTVWAQGPRQAQQDGQPHGTTGSGPAQEKQKPADQQVTGKVLDQDGQPVNRAEVRFEGPKKDKVWTDAQGKFSFTGPPGEYAVIVKAGERQKEFKVKIEDNHLDPSTLVIQPDLPL